MAKRSPKGAPAKAPQQLEVLDPIGAVLGADPDEQLVTQAGIQIRAFLQGLAGFFTTAKALENAAVARLEQAKRIVPPKTGADDAQVQAFIKLASADKRAVESHWQITSTISQFHRRMTARRAKATEALEAAASIAQRHHNAYVEAERRRVAEAQEQARLAAEAKARADRELELQRLEAEAIAREEASADLSEREQVFVESYTTPGYHLGDGQRSAQRAGYKDPLKAASRLLSSRKVQAAIQARQEAIAIRHQAAAVAEQPLEVEEVDAVQADVEKVGSDRTYHRGEVLDEAAFIAAVIAGKHGIPWDVLTVNQSKLNEYARSLQKRLNLWPGVRHVSTTKTV